jgi:hypothetical protein
LDVFAATIPEIGCDISGFFCGEDGGLEGGHTTIFCHDYISHFILLFLHIDNGETTGGHLSPVVFAVF